MKLVSSVFNLQASYILGIITGFNNWFVGLYGLYVIFNCDLSLFHHFTVILFSNQFILIHTDKRTAALTKLSLSLNLLASSSPLQRFSRASRGALIFSLKISVTRTREKMAPFTLISAIRESNVEYCRTDHSYEVKPYREPQKGLS